MENTPHLSKTAYGNEWDARVNRSVPGMAHFAFTGPDSTTCRQCEHWGRAPTFKRDGEHRLRRRTCQKFLRMCRADAGPAVDAETPSCRHYVARDTAPDLVRIPARKADADPQDA